jgi:hypothetical protein
MPSISSTGRLVASLFSLWLFKANAAPQGVANGGSYSSSAVSPTVTIPSGVIVGTSAASVNAYLGIPFAQSPPERFSPPVPAPAWTSPLQAQQIKPACIQQFMGQYSYQHRFICPYNLLYEG